MNSLVRSDVGPSCSADTPCIAVEDPLRQLSQVSLQALVRAFAISSTADLLRVPDNRILNVVAQAEGCGGLSVNEVALWLKRQRHEVGDLVSTPLEARAEAAAWTKQLCDELTGSIVHTIKADGVSAAEVARRAGTSREAVAALTAGIASSNLELLLKIAAVLGIKVRFKVETRRETLDVA